MDHGLDFAGELAGAVRQREGAWGFIARFTAEWLVPLADGDGFAEDELQAAERRLGLRLPDAVRELYALLGRRDDLTSNQDALLPPRRLGFDDSGQALVFRVENQGCAQWGIPVHGLHLPDPPVLLRLDGLASRPEPWRPFLERFSLACVEMVLSESVLGPDSDGLDNRECDEAAVRILETRYARLPMPDYPMWAVPEGPPIRWYGGPDVLIRDDARTWLWVRARTPEALQAVRDALPGDWLMAP